MRVTILGCGGASGVPMIGNIWGDCDPQNPKNIRRRSSILVEQGDTTLLVDTGPDLRLQLLDAGIGRLDGVLYTHTHADHTHGIDELRALNRIQRSEIDAWATETDLKHLINKYDYIFDSKDNLKGGMDFYKPSLTPKQFTHGEPFTIGDITVLPYAQDHGFMESTGFRFGDIAYTTDAVELPDESFEALKGVKTWIVCCLQDKPHPTHAHFDRIMGWIDRVGPKQAILTHLSHRLDYGDLTQRLTGTNAVPAHDGLTIEGADT
jgi:phosphoribosyl 1,2-cyclic phosphate phosphodiesterase